VALLHQSSVQHVCLAFATDMGAFVVRNRPPFVRLLPLQAVGACPMQALRGVVGGKQNKKARHVDDKNKDMPKTRLVAVPC
jgi:hypothetical protein